MGTYKTYGNINDFDYYELASNTTITLGNIDVTDSINPLFDMEVTINPVSAEGYVTYGATEFTYDVDANGFAIERQLVITIGNIDGSYNIKYTYDDVSYNTSPIFTKAGSYVVDYEITFENYSTITGTKTIVINKKNVSLLTIPSITRTYNTNAIKNPVVTTDSDGVISWIYKDSTGETIDNPINVGNYKLEISITSGDNYNAYSKEFDFEIKPYNVELTWHSLEEAYTGSDIYIDVEFKTPLPDTDVTLVITPEKVKDKGTYDICATLAGDNKDNYNIVNANKVFTVNKQIIELPSDMENVYTGIDHNPYSSDLYTRSINEFINADTYEVTLTIKDKENYTWKLADGSVTTEDQQVTYVISKKDISYNEIINADITFEKYVRNNDVTYYLIENQEYDKNVASTPTPRIVYNGMTLTTDDFTLEYQNNDTPYVSEGTESYVIVKGIGNYAGTVKFEFKIVSLIFAVANPNSTVKFVVYNNGRYSVQTSHTTYNQSKVEYITNFKSGQSIESFLTIFEENQRDLITVLDKNNKPITDKSSIIVTGYKIILKDTYGNVKDSLMVAVTGDVNADGVINSQDLVLYRNYITGKVSLTGAQFVAALINGDTAANSQDYILLNNKISGKSDYEASYIQ